MGAVRRAIVSRRDELAIGGLALVVRVVVLVSVTGRRMARSDEGQYLDIARHVAAGRGISSQWPQLRVHPTAFRPPLYPALLGGWIRVVGQSVLAARTLNVVLGTAVVVGVVALGRRLAGRTGGIVAGCAAALFPPLLANDVTALAEPLGLLLILLIVGSFLRSRWWSMGLAAGALLLTKPSGVVLLVVVVAAAGLAARRDATRHRTRAALAAAATAGALAVVVAVPWAVRNAVRLDSATLVTSNGFNLTAVYDAPARALGDFVDPVYAAAYQSLDERLLRWDEGRWNDELTRRGLRGIRDEPTYVARVVGRNALRWFELAPHQNDHPEYLDGRNVRLRHLTLPLYYPVTAVGIVGLALGARGRGVRRGARRGVALLAALALATTAASLVLVATPRLRAPVDLACCLGCGVAAAAWRSRRDRGSDRAPAGTTSGVTHVIRPATASDEPFLRQMLHEALFVPPGDPPLDPDLVRTEPLLAALVDGFGTRDGDRGAIAEVGGVPVGAAWLRLVPGGYGYVEPDVPELSIALHDGHRNGGIGGALLANVIAGAERTVPGISLSCDDRNPAMRLYERFGFEEVRRDGPHSVVMLRRLGDEPLPPMAFSAAP